MKKKRVIRFALLAAGILVSAAFYAAREGGSEALPVFMEGAELTGQANEDTEPAGQGNEDADADRAGESSPGGGGAKTQEAETAEGTAGRQTLSLLLEDPVLSEKLEAVIRSAVREELMEISRDGYLEAALKAAAEEAARQAAEKEGLVDLNTADSRELMSLSGIGEKKAGDIIAYREAHGGFARIEDIMEVNGISRASFEKIKDKITV